MQILLNAALLTAAYLLGAIPVGLFVVKWLSGQDVRTVESGRTGGTNVFRAAGALPSAITIFLDGFKGTLSVWLVLLLAPGSDWLAVFAALLAIIGHNYSIFLLERDNHGRLRFRGGAGGATCAGGSVGLWFPSLFIIAPLALVILYFVGYASVATMSIALLSMLLFAIRAWMGASPWEYVFYGFFSFLLLAWSLRPNIRRLIQGNERMVGWRVKKKKNSQS
jgi:glycerol-3-phosphate acyltransferase PlsY